MIETDIRIVYPGANLYIWTRRATVTGSDLTVDLCERACGSLRHRYGMAAIPIPGDHTHLVVATAESIEPIHLEQDEWELDVKDAGEPSRRLLLTDPEGPDFIPQLVERALEANLARRTKLWTLDSPRIWYEEQPFIEEEGIAAYRRYEIGTVLIDRVGVGVAVDVGTAFFTIQNLSYFFDPNVPATEQKRRLDVFAELTHRQEEQKGTLLYDNGRSRVKCYFESAPPGMTCSTTGKMRVKGKSYDSLLAYYRAEYSELAVNEDTLAVRVSFPGIERPQPVAADRVRLRVMNDNVPESLSSVDKIEPSPRRELLISFWDRIEPRPLGKVTPGFKNGFWRPRNDQVIQMSPPNLIFGQGRCLEAPTVASVESYRSNFRQRLEYLEETGCYSIPPDMARTLYCAVPKTIDAEIGQQLATDLADEISKWSHRSVSIGLLAYDSVSDAVERLRDSSTAGGMVVFVLNEEPVAYYEAAFQLSDWRIKRITQNTLYQHYRYLKDGIWDRKTQSKNSKKGKARWETFIHLNALDILQLLDAVPFRIEQAGPYEAQLAIDVGYDRQHFALSLLVAREEGKTPSFRIVSHVHKKPDHQTEAINPIMLAEQMIRLFESVLPRMFHPVKSLLILRDGRLCGREPEGIDNAIATLKEQGYLSPDSRVDWVDIHKDTLKNVRIWEIDGSGTAENVLEGTLLQLNANMIIVASTGAATLRQGTAAPFMIVGNGHCYGVMDAAKAACLSSQLNWSSPSVAQQLPLYLKRTDDELKARAAQEVRRLH